jgi:hypothetical protein
LEPPFTGATEGWIGIFKYEITETADGEGLSEGCTLYDSQWKNAPFEALTAGQICAVMAPSFAILSILVSLVEVVCCFFRGSFLVISVLFLVAAGIQAGTFSLFAEPSFCFDSGASCSVGKAVYFSATAAAAFFLSCILFCCSPRPNPCMNRHRRTYDENTPVAPVIEPPEITAMQTASGDLKESPVDAGSSWKETEGADNKPEWLS